MASIINASTAGAGGIVTTADSSGVLNIQTAGTTAISVNATQNATFTKEANIPNTFGFKNRIINGAMQIDQRNAGAAITPTANAYVTDRWMFSLGGDPSRFTLQQNAGAVTPPAGFTNYLGATVVSAVPTPNTFRLSQFIEGFNIADLAWGTANAAPITLSFWVRSSVTGLFGGSIGSNDRTRTYPYTYTISAANTWEYKTITIPGDTTGTWLTTNGVGIGPSMSLGEGSGFKGTANTWASANYYSATGTVDIVNTLGATFYITGVQLEKGTTATSFDYRPYGQELALCQRYYYQITGTDQPLGSGYYRSSGIAYFYTALPVEMRSAPTLNPASGSNYFLLECGAAVSAFGTTVSLYRASKTTAFLQSTIAGGTASSGCLVSTNNASSYVGFNAEF